MSDMVRDPQGRYVGAHPLYIARELIPSERPRIRYINAIYALLDEYIAEVRDSPLTATSQTDYEYFATCFVRWLHNDYTPGMGVK